jgi:signal transduction histidine kinase
LTKWGEERIISWTNNELKRDGEIIGTLSFGRDVTDQIHSTRRLQEYQDRLRKLAADLTLSEERERRRLAEDLHDQVGQSLAAARMEIAAAKKIVTEPSLMARLDSASQAMLSAVHDTREIMYKLSPPAMNELGLDAAIAEWLENRIAFRHGLKTDFRADSMDISLTEDTRSILFRSVRELLTNVVKHARARMVSVRMLNENDSIIIIVEDDGVGFNISDGTQIGSHVGGFGLFSIQERMADLGGSLEIESQPDHGCRAVLTLPLAR